MGTFAEGLIGIVLDGRYRLDAVLGEGGMGSVFRAHHLAMDRKVAVKLLKPHLTSDDIALQRFAAEARRTMRVDSPHAVKVLDFGVTAQHDYYIVLEYLDGRTVQRELEIDGPFSPVRTVHIARQTLHALAAAHDSGLVHRDIKPDNVLLLRSGDDPDFAKVLDFGVAKLMQGATPSSKSALKLTQQGMVFGTPEFMSPEQACGLALDGRSDLYALAATMFAMLTGLGLFSGGSAIEWLTHHARTPPPHLGQVSAELGHLVELDALLQRCLAKRAEQRPSSASEMNAMLADIQAKLTGNAAPTPGRPVKTVFSSSLYVPAIVQLPEAETKPERTSLLRPDSQLDDTFAPPPSRRAIYLGVGGVMLAGVIALTIATALHGRGDPPVPDPRPVAHAPSPADAALPAPPPATDAPPPSDAAPADAPARVAADATVAAIAVDARVVAPPPADAMPTPSAADEHLANARKAQQTGNALRELSEADAAHRLEPGNQMARYLMADAMLARDSKDEACEILKQIMNFPLARQRAQTAKCADQATVDGR